ncbi:MAG TPA: Rid family hydrolase, partial [Dongiaceae bacterium]|nr:Rid family hydrolase [Dongiaceae bacterium]
MAIKFHNPKSVSLAGNYSLGAEVPQGARLFYVSGQVGVDSKGKLQAGIDKQVETVWKNIIQVLKSAGMGLS